jgi:hypothetical protein
MGAMATVAGDGLRPQPRAADLVPPTSRCRSFRTSTDGWRNPSLAFFRTNATLSVREYRS